MKIPYKQLSVLIIFTLLPLSLFSQQLTSGRGSHYTLKTKHFRIHYPKNQRRYAIETAHMAEEIYSKLEPLYKSQVTVTSITLVFQTDTVNAFATSYGFDQIVLFLDQPRLGEFSRYNHWTRLLLTHEFTHILSLRYNRKRGNDWIRWLFAIPPNILSPFGLIEGTAVHQESKTGVGRLHDPLTEMIIRTAVLGNEYPRLGEIMNGTKRWPYGSAGYLYGAQIIDQIEKHNGPGSIYRYWNDKNIPLDPDGRLPYGSHLGLLYKQQKESDTLKFLTQVQAIKEKGETQFKRLTFDSNFKRFLSINDRGELLYFGMNMRSTPGLFRIKPGHKQKFERRQLSSNGLTEKANKKIYSEDYLSFSGFGIRHELYDGDSFLLDRLTPNKHISYPTLSKDGKQIVFMERNNHTRYLKVALLDYENKINQEQKLFEVPFDGIIQYTDFSPNQQKVLSIIRTSKNGFASLFVCDLNSKSCKEHLNTKGIITQPRFLNNTEIVFSSDANSIYNIYKYNIETKKTIRLTRTLTGLFYPTPSEDGKLYALRYFKKGYDVVSMNTGGLLSQETDLFSPSYKPDIENENNNEGSPDINTKGKGLPQGWEEEHYNGMLQIKPYLISILGPITSLNLGVEGRDPLFRHSFLIGVGADEPAPVAIAMYDYTRYKVGLSMLYYGNYWKKKKNPGCLEEDTDPYRFLCDSPWVFQESAVAYIRYTDPGRYFSEQILLGYAHTKIRNARRNRIIEYDARDLNLSGPSVILLFGSTQFYPKSISPERGWRLFLATDYYTKPESKDRVEEDHYHKIEYGVAEGGMSLYLPSFWDHHVNYLSAYGYTSYGPDRELQKVRLNRFVRGLAYNKAPKDHAAAVVTYEYRLPFSLYSHQINDNRPGTMLNNVGINLFVDYGASFDRVAYKENWIGAYGLSLDFSLSIAYLHLPNLKLTYAKGTGVAGESQVYLSFNAGLGGSSGYRSTQKSTDKITKPYHRAMPGFQEHAGYFRDPRAGGILE